MEWIKKCKASNDTNGNQRMINLIFLTGARNGK